MARKTNAQLEAEVVALRADLAKINDVLNDRADRHSLCDEYEEVCSDLNKELKSGFQLKPRGEEHQVRFDLILTRRVTVPVFAREEYDATDRARVLDEEEMFKLSGLPSELYELVTKAGFDIDSDDFYTVKD